jgi:16S rRNA (cytidine1402-2'-O)-methyltransferase
MSGKLYLIPSPISENTAVIPADTITQIAHLQHFMVEEIRTARRYLSSLKIFSSIEALHFQVLNKDTDPSALRHLMAPVHDGYDMGVLSEAGCPGIADPGALAVGYAHQHHIRVVPLIGPSSLFLALMGSGLNGQCFAFHGYLPIDAREAGERIKLLERESKTKNQTQMVIETPYRNNSLFGHLVKNLGADTLLTVAFHVTAANEQIITRKVKEWNKEKPVWEKAPAVFLFLAH